MKIQNPLLHPNLRYIVLLAGIALAYLIAAEIGLSLAFSTKQVTAIWPPTGIAVAALLLWGYRVFPAIYLGAFLAMFSAGSSMLVAAVIAIGNTLGPVAALFALRCFVGLNFELSKVRDVFGLILFAAVLAMTITATNGVATLAFFGVIPWSEYGSVWLVWWVGDVMGVLVFTALILSWTTPRCVDQNKSLIEQSAFWIGLVLASILVFNSKFFQTNAYFPLLYIIFPFIIWASFRFSARETTLAIAVVIGLATWSATHDQGLFPAGNLDQRLIFLEMFMAVIAATGIVLCALTAERTRAQKALQQTHDALAASNERFTTVLEELDSAISVCANDQHTKSLLFANHHYRHLFGSSVSGHQQFSQALAQCHSVADTPHEIYLAVINQWFEVRQRTIRWADDLSAQMQIATDITARKTAEEFARQHHEKIQLTSRLMNMGEMASSLAHELNQPLTAIANYNMGAVMRLRSLSKCGQPIDPQTLLEMLQKTATQAQRAGHIIRQIRAFVKRQEPRRQRCQIRSIIDDALSFATIEANKKHIMIRTVVSNDIPDVEVDPILIEQVLFNLLKNGIDAMQYGSASTEIDPSQHALTLRIHEHQQWIEFSVRDYGAGINEDQYEQLFEPFYSTKVDGMGLGLNICRSIIEFHYGRLWAKNHAEGGCIFYFTLPKIQLGLRNIRNMELELDEV